MPKDIVTEEGKFISEREMLKYATRYHKTPFLHFGVRLILFSVRVSASMRPELINRKTCGTKSIEINVTATKHGIGYIGIVTVQNNSNCW
jgi:hypothetical protein